MLTYNIESRGKKPKYYFIYQMVRKDIENGILGKGQKLPSKRSLAEHLGVSLITVENAYQMLKDEGYIEPRERSGYFVCEIHAIHPGREKKHELKMLPEISEQTDDGRLSDNVPQNVP